MIVLVAETKDEIHIKIIVGFQTHMECSIRGYESKDITDLFMMLKAYELAGNKKKIILIATMCDDESTVGDFLQSDMKDKFFQHSQNMAQQVQKSMQGVGFEPSLNSIPDVQMRPETKKEQPPAIKCPKCGGDHGMKGSDGSIHPCLKCLKIDLGVEINKERKARIRRAHQEEHGTDIKPPQEGSVKDGK